MRWLTYIRLFDFTVKQVPGNKNGGVDPLSRRGYANGDGEEDDTVDDYFDAKLYSIQASSAPRDPTTRIYLQAGEYDGEDLNIGQYLETLERPPNLMDDEFQKLRKKALFTTGTFINGLKSVEYPLGE